MDHLEVLQTTAIEFSYDVVEPLMKVLMCTMSREEAASSLKEAVATVIDGLLASNSQSLEVEPAELINSDLRARNRTRYAMIGYINDVAGVVKDYRAHDTLAREPTDLHSSEDDDDDDAEADAEDDSNDEPTIEITDLHASIRVLRG
jgi:hypothetical protein